VRSTLPLCCLALLAAPPSAWCATQGPRVQPGARIRFDAPSLGGRLTGTLVAWESDTLVVMVDGQAEGLGLIVAADSVTRLEVGSERPMTVEGMGVGLLAGALLAVVASPDWVDDNGDCTTAPCLAYKVSSDLDTRVTVLSLVGALLGGIAGSETKTHTWAQVRLDRVTMGVSFAF
jgi:hypothetical protein